MRWEVCLLRKSRWGYLNIKKTVLLGQKRLDLTGHLMNKHDYSEKMGFLLSWKVKVYGAIAQLGERVLCKHEVVGSIPSGSTNPLSYQR